MQNSSYSGGGGGYNLKHKELDSAKLKPNELYHQKQAQSITKAQLITPQKKRLLEDEGGLYKENSA